MIYSKDSSIGSGSSDSDRNEGKKNGDACEGNVYNVDVESRNLVDHIGNRFQPNPKYLSCHAFSHHEVGIAGEEGKIITNRIQFVTAEAIWPCKCLGRTYALGETLYHI